MNRIDPRRQMVLELLRVYDQLTEQLKRQQTFLQRLLDPDDLGWAVSEEVREKVRSILKEDE